MSGKNIVDFVIRGKVGVAVLSTLLGSLLGLAGMGVKVSTLTDVSVKQEQRIEILERNYQTVCVALARIEENTANIKERMSDLKQAQERRK